MLCINKKNKIIPYEVVEIIYRFSDIETKINIGKYFMDLRPFKLKIRDSISLNFIVKILKIRVNYNVVLFELRNNFFNS